MTQTPSAPSAPAAPSTRSAPIVVPVSQIPQTTAEVRALRSKIDQLTSQLQDFASRRQSVASNLRNADVEARAGYISRLDNLDKSINTLQDQITQANLALSQAPASAITNTSTGGVDPNFAFDRASRNAIPIVAILSVFVFFPLVLPLARMLWRRGSAPAQRPAIDHGAMQRLDALQQSVDTIAIEVERISESQRFVTKLLSERDRPALGAGAAEPVRAAERTGAKSERR